MRRLSKVHSECVRLLWLQLRRNGIPKDIRVRMIKYAASHIFDWETTQLRQERQQIGWYRLQGEWTHGEMLGGMIVEPWEPDFLTLGVMSLKSVYCARRHRGKTWPKQRYHWVWLYK